MLLCLLLLFVVISNGNRTGWSPIRSVIMRVINKIDDLFNHEYDYRPNCDIKGSFF